MVLKIDFYLMLNLSKGSEVFMFKYWQGYEIDGSDTSFDLVLPNQAKVKEFFDFYMSLPIWDQSAGMTVKINVKNNELWSPHRDVSSLEKSFSIENAKQVLSENEIMKNAYIVLRCLRPNLLSTELKETIYSFIKDKDKYVNINPSIGFWGLFNEDSLNVGLVILSESLGVKVVEQDDDVINKEAFEQNGDKQYMELTCGPSFIFEYKEYILSSILEKFPEMGLISNDGCCCDCTYSTKLLSYEVLKIKTSSLQDFFTKLIDDKIISLIALQQKNKRQEYVYNDEEVYLVSNYELRKKSIFANINISINELSILVNKVFSTELDKEKKQKLTAIYLSISSGKNGSRVSFEDFLHVLFDKFADGSFLIYFIVPQDKRLAIEDKLKSNNIDYV